MRSRRCRLLLLSAGLLALLLAAAGFFIYWTQSGPGLDSEADRLAEILGLQPGMTVAEIGAGKGRMAVHLARSLGPSGRLYATEIQAYKLDAIRRAAAAAGLDNITTVEAGQDSTGLPDGCCDVIYMRRVYHHLTDPATIGRGLREALRPGGRLAVIDFFSPRWMFWLRHGIAADVLVAQLSTAGFALERRIDRWSPVDYCIVFRRPALKTPSEPLPGSR